MPHSEELANDNEGLREDIKDLSALIDKYAARERLLVKALNSIKEDDDWFKSPSSIAVEVLASVPEDIQELYRIEQAVIKNANDMRESMDECFLTESLEELEAHKLKMGW